MIGEGSTGGGAVVSKDNKSTFGKLILTAVVGKNRPTAGSGVVAKVKVRLFPSRGEVLDDPGVVSDAFTADEQASGARNADRKATGVWIKDDAVDFGRDRNRDLG